MRACAGHWRGHSIAGVLYIERANDRPSSSRGHRKRDLPHHDPCSVRSKMLHDAPAPRALITAPISSRAWALPESSPRSYGRLDCHALRRDCLPIRLSRRIAAGSSLGRPVSLRKETAFPRPRLRAYHFTNIKVCALLTAVVSCAGGGAAAGGVDDNAMEKRMTEAVTVTCSCCGAAETREDSSVRRPCQCSPFGCFVSARCIKHCPMDHPECGKPRGRTPSETYYRDTFRCDYSRG